jgi:hypothetical protein
LNLLRHEALRELRFVASDFPTGQDDGRALQSINALLLALPPSSQLDVVIVYQGFEFSPNCATPWSSYAGYVLKPISESSCGCRECIENLRRLKVLAEACRIRKFRLVFSVEASEERAQFTKRALELQLGAHHEDEELGSLLSGSSIVSTVPCFASGYI